MRKGLAAVSSGDRWRSGSRARRGAYASPREAEWWESGERKRELCELERDDNR